MMLPESRIYVMTFMRTEEERDYRVRLACVRRWAMWVVALFGLISLAWLASSVQLDAKRIPY